VGRSRPRRQVSEIIRLYNEMVEEVRDNISAPRRANSPQTLDALFVCPQNRKDREEALSKIRGVLGKVFVSPNDTVSFLLILYVNVLLFFFRFYISIFTSGS
jgi:hypothetical protein